MEPLKELFNQAYFLKLATEVKKAHQLFDEKSFLKEVTNNLSERELNKRLRHTSLTLKEFLPNNFQEAVNILKQVVPNLKTGYTTLVFPDFVGLYGIQHFKFSLEALSYFTQFGSSEFAIRVFLKHDFKATLNVMQGWAKSDNVHIRRLASEGCRPRLPWSFKLDEVVKNPELTLPILTSLKEDTELYVKKSVANHINDYSKEHPELVIKILKDWKSNNPHTTWILKHASRTLLKQGNTKALAFFGIKENSDLNLVSFNLKKQKIKIGDNLQYSFLIQNTSKKSISIRLEYAIYFKIANDKLSKKVFKISEKEITNSQTLSFEKHHSFKLLSTRKYYSGSHYIAIIINGKEIEKTKFNLTE